MKITSHDNQLATASQGDTRLMDLRVWMVRNGVTYVMLGAALGGITGTAVQQLLKGDRMPVARHSALLDWGVPEHLLPPAQDVPRGRNPRRAMPDNAPAVQA